MKNVITCSLFFLAAFSISAQHTFSIVAIDEATGKIGSAGATCLTSADCGFCGGAVIISDILPGVGAINAQATVCIPNSNLNNGIDQMGQGNNANEVLTWLQANDDCQFGNIDSRQYGMVTNSTADGIVATGFTGANCLDEAGHLIGSNYSIQGNILIGTYVLDSMESRFLTTQGSFEEKMMAALQGANIPGADSRCLVDGLSSKSSFLRIASPDDVAGNFSVNLIVPATDPGVDPIDSLQTLFNALGLNNVQDPIINVNVNVFPNPTDGVFSMGIASPQDLNLTLLVFDLSGTLVYKKNVRKGQNEISIDSSNGAYVYQLKDSTLGLMHQNTLVIHK